MSAPPSPSNPDTPAVTLRRSIEHPSISLSLGSADGLKVPKNGRLSETHGSHTPTGWFRGCSSPNHPRDGTPELCPCGSGFQGKMDMGCYTLSMKTLARLDSRQRITRSRPNWGGSTNHKSADSAGGSDSEQPPATTLVIRKPRVSLNGIPSDSLEALKGNSISSQLNTRGTRSRMRSGQSSALASKFGSLIELS